MWVSLINECINSKHKSTQHVFKMLKTPIILACTLAYMYNVHCIQYTHKVIYRVIFDFGLYGGALM